MSHSSDKHGSDTDGPDKDLPDEQQLDEYLRGGSAVSQQYRQLRSADVPAELDRLVLRQAQEAVKARPAKSRPWMRWAGPLALAASTVLVVSIVIESGVHEETYLAVPASAPADLPLQQEAAQSNEAQDKAVAGNAADASVVHVVPVEPDIEYDSPRSATVPEAPAPAPPPAVDRALAIQPAAPPASVASQFTSPPPNASVDEVPAEFVSRDKTGSNAQASARAVAPTPTPAPAPARVRAPVQAQEQEASAGLEEVAVTGAMKRQEQKRSAGPRNTVAAPSAGGSASDADEKQDEPRNYSDPQLWLRDIRQLRQENKHQQADREWRRFRYVFPNYEVAETDPARGALR